MAKISHHGSCRSKSSTEFKCICFEKGNRWDGKCWTRQCKTHEIRQCLYRSGNKTMQKYPEDNQATGLFTCESFTTQNPKFIKICHQMRGTGQDGRRRNQKRTSTTRNHCCQKDIHTIQSVRFNHQRTNYSKKDQYWIPEKRNTTVHSQPQRCFQCQKFGHTKNSCKGKAVCAGCGEGGHNLDDCKNEPKCVNCQGDHVAISRDCPKWKIEKDIVTLRYTEIFLFADARKRLQPRFDPSKDSYATVTQTPPQSSRPLPPWAKKIRLPIDFGTEIEYLKYILNYCLARLDTLDEITPENPVPRDAPSSQTTPEQPNESTILNTESALQSAASNDDENEIEMLTMSNKRTFNEDSSEEDTNNPLPAKKPAISSPASEQSGTRVPKGRGGGDLPKISAFPAKTPKSGGRGSSQGDKSPARAPRFSNTGEGSTSSAQGGRNRAAINRQSLSKPPGTASKDKTKSKEKNTPT